MTQVYLLEGHATITVMQFRFCPRCSAKLVLRKPSFHEEAKQLCCPRCSFVFYQNSVPTASALIVQKGRILFVRRAISPRKGFWDVPGGFLKKGEHPEDGMKREVLEELGLFVEPKKLLGIFMDEYFHASSRVSTLNVYYLASIVRGHLRTASDVCEARWFSRAQLPRTFAFKSNTLAIRAWQRLCPF